MTEQTPASGNRWETSGDEPEQTATADPEIHNQAGPGSRPWRDRVRPVLAGAVAGTAIVTGIGGFAIGRATADARPGGGDQQQIGFFPGDRDGDGDGDGDGDRDGRDHGFPPGPGGVPGQGDDGDVGDQDSDDLPAQPGSST